MLTYPTPVEATNINDGHIVDTSNGAAKRNAAKHSCGKCNEDGCTCHVAPERRSKRRRVTSQSVESDAAQKCGTCEQYVCACDAAPWQDDLNDKCRPSSQDLAYFEHCRQIEEMDTNDGTFEPLQTTVQEEKGKGMA